MDRDDSNRLITEAETEEGYEHTDLWHEEVQ